MSPDTADFIAQCRERLAQQTALHAAAWRLGSESQWMADMDAGTIRFEFADRSVQAAFQVVGTYDRRSGSFLWGWDHPSVPDTLRLHARLALEWGRDHAVSAFTTRSVNCTEDDAWGYAAVTSRLADASGVYRGPAGDTLVFMTFGDVTIHVRAPRKK
jgi:hypothetical protein